MLRYLTAGESHGPALTGIIEGLPAGIPVSEEDLNRELARRQAGYGRGGRMDIESDRAKVLSGIRHARTLGSPISFVIENLDWKNWQSEMSQFGDCESPPLTKPRPGHADMAGAIRFGHSDIRNVLERASARETAARVACGYFSKALLNLLQIEVLAHVVQIGKAKTSKSMPIGPTDRVRIDASDVRCIDEQTAQIMRDEIDRATREKDTLGGIFEVLVFGLPPGIGDYTHWDGKLDARIAFAVKSIQAIKGIEFGDGFSLAEEMGSLAHDQIYYSEDKGYHRRSNRSGGFEGGMSDGETLIIRAAMKPIATIPKPLATIDMTTGEPCEAIVERSDTCAVPAASVIAEACVAIEVAAALLEQFGTGDIDAVQARYLAYKESAQIK